MPHLIIKKKLNKELSTEEIKWIVENYTAGKIHDYQMSALLMAVYFNGLSDRETVDLTLAMRDSGEILDLSSIDGIKVDKHSSGGVGDKVSIVLVGIIGALDIPFAKMSGRGLGHTGGTIDKLESIPGFRTNLSIDEFIDNVKSINVAISCQTSNLAPADKKLYALRDVTGTVDNVSLIASSIMSKKLASGCDGIVLDVTTGSGAFMNDIEDAIELSKKMVNIGKILNKETIAVVTNMDEPLGNAVGNALEVAEAIQALKGYGPADLMEVVITIASYMLIVAKKTDDLDKAKDLIQSVIDNGSAYNKFIEFVERQGGDSSYVKNYDSLINASIIREVKAEKSGYIHRVNALNIGNASLILGGGREELDDIIDSSVGIYLNKKVSDSVKTGQILAYIYGNDEKKVNDAYKEVVTAYDIQDEVIDKPKMIIDIIK
ncbi:MAG TPA: thymidine phosphorylase [Lachnospiraceae bacterium]|nr:thymidine phosphorylase [Lachnospiraceae bacterium]